MKRIVEGDAPERVIHEGTRCIQVTARELKVAIAANPSHSVALAYARVNEMPDDKILQVEAVDLHALLENVEVRLDKFKEDGQVVVRKTLKGKKTHERKPKRTTRSRRTASQTEGTPERRRRRDQSADGEGSRDD